MGRILQFHSGSAVGDAVTNGMFFIQDILADARVQSDIYVEHRDPRLDDRLKLIGEIDARADDLLLLHHSMGHDLMPFLEALPCRKLLVYHNITPPSFFGEVDPLRHYALLGYAQLSILRNMVSASIADSDYNSVELRRRGFRDVQTIPLLRDFRTCRQAPYNQTLQLFDEPRYQLLFVGRIVANKGQLDLVRFMAKHADSFDHPLHLTLVGHADHGEVYAADLKRLVEAEGLADRVLITGHVSDEDLYGWYRASDAYVSLSGHEGFGVPLVEAFAFDLPVVALDSSAVSSTLGGAGVLLRSREPDHLRDQLAPVLENRLACRRLIGGQRDRLRQFDRASVAEQFLRMITPYLPADIHPDGAAFPAPSARAAREYVVEGSCETSYSLAIVNRNLALALKAGGRSAALKPLEGMPGYRLDADALELVPEIKPLLAAEDGRAEHTITIRNLYPPRPAGMLGDIRLMNFFWEETEVPAKYVAMMNRYLDGVLVASRFGKRVLRNSGLRIPVEVVGCGVDHFHPRRAARGLDGRGPFTFLHVSSGMPRKGIEELLLAYCLAFTRKDDVRLIIKTYDNVSSIVRQLFAEMVQARPNAPLVQVITSEMTDEDIAGLYAASDAMVLPTRGEGFNLPAAEALAAGLPTIVTNHSAHIDFCDEGTSRLIDFRFELSSSHLATGFSMWARPDFVALARAMRAMASPDKDGAAETVARHAAGQGRAAGLTWSSVAARTEEFVNQLMLEKPVEPRMKLAWFSTWNTKCGIAAYSRYLVESLRPNVFDVTVFANVAVPLEPDPPSVHRPWNFADEDLGGALDTVLAGSFDAAVFQFNYGFFRRDVLGRALVRLAERGIDTYVFFHKTEDAGSESNPFTLRTIVGELATATRLVVHSVDDVNRLKEYGLVDNVVLLPQGVPDAPAFDAVLAKRFLGLAEASPVIAAYGFLVPPKGIPELIAAFGLIRARSPRARLILLNSEYPDPVSREEAALCKGLIDSLGLADSVTLITDYLDNDDVMLMLQAADVVVYPYQHTGESSSAAVRVGLAAQRPVAVTPLRIFDEVADLTYRLPGASATEIAAGLEELLGDPERQRQLIERQRTWLRETAWSRVGKRFGAMLIGLHEDRHDVRVGAEAAPFDSVDVGEPAGALPTSSSAALSSLALRPEAFVRLVCQRAFGRTEDPRQAAWIATLQDGSLTRQELANALEAEASAAGHLRVERVISFADLRDADDLRFVEEAYLRVLGRKSDPSGLEYHHGQLQAGARSRPELIQHFLASDEFLDRDEPVKIVETPVAAIS